MSIEFVENKFSITGDYDELIMILQFCLIGINRNPFKSEDFSRVHDKVVKILNGAGRLHEIGVI